MSNYYKSDCCGEQVKTELRGATFEYICLKCDLPCKVTAVIDKPGGVPEYTSPSLITKGAGESQWNTDKTETYIGGVNFDPRCQECGFDTSVTHSVNCSKHPSRMMTKTEQIREEWKSKWNNDEFYSKYDSSVINPEFIELFWLRKLAEQREEIINELGSNPNEDGSVSPNIQHWIEKKQAQLRKLK